MYVGWIWNCSVSDRVGRAVRDSNGEWNERRTVDRVGGRLVVDLNTEEGYCENCDRERMVVKTMPWQDDICKSCGADVPGEGEYDVDDSS